MVPHMMPGRVYGPGVDRNPGKLLAEAVRRHRARLNISQKELAERSGLGSSTIKRIELGGGGRAGVKTIQALAKGLGVEPSDLTSPPPPLPVSLDRFIDAWVAAERMRPRVEPPVLPEEITWLKKLGGEIWSALPLTEATLEALIKAHRSREQAKRTS